MVYYDVYGNPVVVPTPTDTAIGIQQLQDYQQGDNRFMLIPSKNVVKTIPMGPGKIILFLDESVRTESNAHLKDAISERERKEIRQLMSRYCS